MDFVQYVEMELRSAPRTPQGADNLQILAALLGQVGLTQRELARRDRVDQWNRSMASYRVPRMPSAQSLWYNLCEQTVLQSVDDFY